MEQWKNGTIEQSNKRKKEQCNNVKLEQWNNGSWNLNNGTME